MNPELRARRSLPLDPIHSVLPSLFLPYPFVCLTGGGAVERGQEEDEEEGSGRVG